MTKFLHRLGVNSARHPLRTIGLWLVAAVVVFLLSGAIGGSTENKWTVPGADSQAALDRLEKTFPPMSKTNARIVVHRAGGLEAGDHTTMDSIRAEVAGLPHVVTVSDPFDQAAPTVSRDGSTAFAVVSYDYPSSEIPTEAPEQLTDAVDHVRPGGLQVELGGEVAEAAQSTPEGSEAIGLAVAVVVLLISLGSAVAMALPILLAMFALLVGLGGVGILCGLIPVPDVTTTIAMMIGLGVGIDYCLFVLSRYRHTLAEGKTVVEAAGIANATSGQAVVFAGATVVIAILGLKLSGLPPVAAMGYGTAIVVASAVCAAVTLLPAFLGLVGERVNGLRRSVRERNRHHQEVDPMSTVSGRWAARVGRKPVRYAVGSFVVMVLLAVPVLGLRIGFADAGSKPKSETTRQAYDLMAKSFGKGSNGVLLVTTELHGDDRAVVQQVGEAIAADAGVASVSPPVFNERGNVAVLTATPRTSPQDEKTTELVDRLRDDILPGVTQGTHTKVLVGGQTATLVDLSEKVTSRLPLFIGAVVVLSFVLLLIVFRSIAVPLKAAVMNMLSIGAAYGVMVAMFQWGWGKELIGLETTIPINPFVPMIMFAILFGLSMDYEVFLISRIREEWARTHDGHDSVVTGLASTARVITSAAIIMISVFVAFVASPDPTVKAIGLGLAVAVLLDATVVRMVLVPATMALMGDANWWLPRWLDRILPHIDIEGGEGLEDAGPAGQDELPEAAERIAA
jgi:RND superfamily putative drug exporter